jgi:RNA polymerase sigma-70 factor (ECF subfamily)
MKPKDSKRRLHEIYRANASFLLYYLRQLKVTPEEADDLLQESFLRLHNNLEKIESGKERSFLITTAKNLVIDRYRKGKTQKTQPVGEAIDPQAEALWVSDPQRDFEVEAVGYLIDEIARSQTGGECFRLFYRDGLSLKEIAEQLDQPIGTVASKVARLRNKFKDIIKHRLQEQPAPTIR